MGSKLQVLKMHKDLKKWSSNKHIAMKFYASHIVVELRDSGSFYNTISLDIRDVNNVGDITNMIKSYEWSINKHSRDTIDIMKARIKYSDAHKPLYSFLSIFDSCSTIGRQDEDE